MKTGQFVESYFLGYIYTQIVDDSMSITLLNTESGLKWSVCVMHDNYFLIASNYVENICL